MPTKKVEDKWEDPVIFKISVINFLLKFPNIFYVPYLADKICSTVFRVKIYAF